MKLQTVNVIEYISGSLRSIHSFLDNAEGNEEAEKLFTLCAKDNKFSKKDIKVGLDEGCLESSDYQLFICHSE
jgi:hypothetical protein